MQTLTKAESGCLPLADITGYTAYLKATELEHAQDVLADLLETLVTTIEPVFTLSKLEGHAAFAYANDVDVSPTIILDAVEAGYFALKPRLRNIDNATSCECNACVLIPQLDLKYFVHHGECVVRRIAGTEELTETPILSQLIDTYAERDPDVQFREGLEALWRGLKPNTSISA